MANLKIDEIQITPVKSKDGLVAFASCVLNNQFYLGNVAVYSSPSSPDGYRLVYPVKTLSNGRTIPCVHPITRDAGNAIQNAVIVEYKKLMEKVVKIDEKNNPCM